MNAKPIIGFLGILIVIILAYLFLSPRVKNSTAPNSSLTPGKDNAEVDSELKQKSDEKSTTNDSVPEIQETAPDMPIVSSPEVERVRALPTAEVYKILTVDGKKDDDQLNIAQIVLIERARAHDKEVVRLLVKGLEGRNSDDNYFLIWLLKEIRTQESLEALLRLVTSNTYADERLNFLEGIKGAGLLNDDGFFNEEVSPVLERYLGEGRNDPELLSAVATGISDIGSESGMARLLSELRTANASEQAIIAEAMTHAINANAVSPLAQELYNDPDLSEDISKVAGNTLASMGLDAPTKSLMTWSSGLTRSDTQRQALVWLKKTQNVDAIRQELPILRFKDPAFKSEVEAVPNMIEAEIRAGTEMLR